MKIYTRVINLKRDVLGKSLFLFGPRQTGKTFLLKHIFPRAPFYDLLQADVFLKVSQRPQIIREELAGSGIRPAQPVIVDEIQKLPILLDEVHYMIERERFKFILTGSSPRKLKRGGANLLGGRAWTRHLFPLTSREIPNYDLLRILNYGSIPSIYDSANPEQDLSAYVGNYLKEEIQAEGLARKIENFSRFLQTASLTNTELLNFANIANDAGVPAKTVAEYYTVLQDTLIGYLLEPYTKTKKRKAISTAKFYLFDVGVANFLAGRKNVRPRTELFGKSLEQFIFTEIKAQMSYANDMRPLYFWRSKSGYEVDFIIGDETAIEVKSANLVSEKHLVGLNALSEDLRPKAKIVVSMDTFPRKIKDVRILPVSAFLEELWSRNF